jgi:hypothetical protein
MHTDLVVISIFRTPGPGELVAAGKQQPTYKVPTHRYHDCPIPSRLHVTEVLHQLRTYEILNP